MAYSYSTLAAQVDVDDVTGRVTVEKIWVAHDVGFALNPLSVEGQVQGGVWMGMGQAISEETNYHEGLPITSNMLDYRVPTIVESPDIEVKIIESIDPNGPFGAKEASEGCLSGIIPAIANAVYDATGVRLFETPLTPERIIDGQIRLQRLIKKQATAGAD